ncbi:hypothetical protein LCL95_17840 [Bacillus timonensis]|nr:hypothetical protein [Bacillus timonensis]
MLKKLILPAFLSISLFGCSNNNIENVNSYLYPSNETTKVEVQKDAKQKTVEGLLPEYSEEILFQSTHIVAGTVKEILPSKTVLADDTEQIITQVIIKVEETLKGKPFKEIAVSRVGGVSLINGEKYQVSTKAPHLTKGEKVLLFLNPIQNESEVPEGFTTENYFYMNTYGKWTEVKDEYVFTQDDEIVKKENKENFKEKIKKM